MIKGNFALANDMYEVVVDGNNLFFNDVSTNTISTIEGLRLNKSGVLKEFPDLENNEEWRKIAIERLKEHMKTFSSENDKLDYVKDELKKFGWDAQFKQRAGFRPEKFK